MKLSAILARGSTGNAEGLLPFWNEYTGGVEEVVVFQKV